jgi:hypothetical protein
MANENAKTAAVAAKATDSAATGTTTAAGAATPVVESNPNAAIVPLTDKDKIKSIKAALGSDRVSFTTQTIKDANGKDVVSTAFEQAEAKLFEAAGKTNSFHGLEVIARDGIETADRIVVATVGVRIKAVGDSPAVNGYKAIVAFSQPTVEEFLQSLEESAMDFVRKLIEREATDVQFSQIRQAETIAQLQQAVEGVPQDVSGIVVTSRETGNGLDTDVFDTMWSPFRIGWLKEKAPALVELLPQKPEVIKAIRSKAYALANPKTAAIEERDFFVRIANAMIALAPNFKDKDGKDAPQDTSVIESWLAERDTLALNYKAEIVPDASKLAGLDF